MKDNRLILRSLVIGEEGVVGVARTAAGAGPMGGEGAGRMLSNSLAGTEVERMAGSAAVMDIAATVLATDSQPALTWELIIFPLSALCHLI